MSEIPAYARGYETLAGREGRTMGASTPAWRPDRRAREDAPNVVVVLLDDLGFADLSPYVPFTGGLRHVRYVPGPPADYDPREIARRRAASAAVYD